MKKIIIIVLAIAVYSNIGWILGTFFSQLANQPEKQTELLGKAALGGGSFLKNLPYFSGYNVIIFWGILWPIGMALVLGSWIVYFVYYIGWLIFGGGIAKLLGII